MFGEEGTVGAAVSSPARVGIAEFGGVGLLLGAFVRLLTVGEIEGIIVGTTGVGSDGLEGSSIVGAVESEGLIEGSSIVGAVESEGLIEGSSIVGAVG